MSSTSPVFRTPKTRRLVSAWLVQTAAEHVLTRVTEFQDIFDQVNLMSGDIKADGAPPEKWPVAARKELSARFHDLGVSTLSTYGEHWEGGFLEAIRSPGTIAAAVRNLADECEATGADGVDVDLEALPAEARFAYTDFIAQLSDELHGRSKLLSICTAAPSRAGQRDHGVGFLDTSAVARYADHLRPMNYDLFWPAPNRPGIGPTSTALWARDRMERLVAEVPRHKVVMGLPTYSLDWDVAEIGRSRQIYDHEWVAAREQESGARRAWCYQFDASLIRYRDAEDHPHLLWVTDARSTVSHLETVDCLDLAGVCFWCLKGEAPRIWEGVRQHFRRWD